MEKEDKDRVAVLKRGATYFVLAAMSVVLHERNGSTFLNKLKVEVAESKKTTARLRNYAIAALEWYVEAMQDLAKDSDQILTLVRSEDTWAKLRPKIESKWKVYGLSKKAMEEGLPKL